MIAAPTVERVESLADSFPDPEMAVVQIVMLVELGATDLDLNSGCEALICAHRCGDELAFFRAVVWRRIAERRLETARAIGSIEVFPPAVLS